MRFWQHLRWKIIATNMIVAALVVLIFFVSAAAYTRASLPETSGSEISSASAESSDGLGETNTSPPEQLEILRSVFLDAIPYSLILGLCAGLAASLLLTQAIMKPFLIWAHKSRRISRGLYADRLEVNSDDELGELAESFNRMAEALDEVQQRRVALVGYLSHELRTPLSSLSGYIEGIMDGVFPDTDATLALMYGEARRMRRLVDDLQALSRVQSGQVSLHMGTFELPPFVRQATVKLQPQWINSGIGVEVIEPKRPIVVIADPDRVDQILLNLLANSLNNTPEGGRITVEIVREGDFARVDITDTGYGIPEDEIPYIFERYYRATSTTDRNSSGSGIGLSISRHLAWAMGGELVAISDGPDMGSTFSFFLPISKSHMAPKQDIAP